MYRVNCDEHGVDHTVETEQAAHKHVNVHREITGGCGSVDCEEV